MAAPSSPPLSERSDLSKLHHSLSLNPLPSPPISLAESDLQPAAAETSLSLVGKFWSANEVPLRFIRPAMQKAWKTTAFKLLPLRRNTYQILFSTQTDLDFVLHNRPWCFDDVLFAVKPWARSLMGEDGDLALVQFWAHALARHGLSFPRFMNWCPNLR